jgi:hypothetical protein
MAFIVSTLIRPLLDSDTDIYNDADHCLADPCDHTKGARFVVMLLAAEK